MPDMLLHLMEYSTETNIRRWLCFFALVVVGATACNTMEDCSSDAGKALCDVDTHQCICLDGSIYFNKESKCVEVARLGELCELSEQCQRADPYSICHFFDAFQHLMTCQCKSGFKEDAINGKRRCIQAPKRNNFLGSPHFDSGDAVPIVMGCLAAGLALAACCAGIVQLMRKKNGRSFRREDSQHPHESVALNGFATHPVINGTPMMPPMAPPPPLPPYEYPPIEDLPPSYEEAIKQCAPVEAVPISEPNKM